MRILKVPLVVCLIAGAWMSRIGVDGIRELPHLVYGTPHQRYAARLVYSGSAGTPTGRAWIAAAEHSLAQAVPVRLPSSSEIGSVEGQAAAAFAAFLRRGERCRVTVALRQAETDDRVFVDLFRRTATGFEPIASAGAHDGALDVEIRSDGEYVVRVQRELDASPVSSAMVALEAEPTLLLPVERATRGSVQSLFGAARDGGRRVHHGVDIFAPRGTPVLAASSGVVVSVGTNGLGGKIVWIVRPGYRERHYYAHLDRQLVSVGAIVTAGDVIGTVGNTGNAKTTAPHLHFGIYGMGGAVDPLPYIAPRAGTRPHLIAPSRVARSRVHP